MIKNLLFDLGNVIIDLDIPRSEAELRAYLGDDADRVWAYLERRDLFRQFELGLISEETFWWAFQYAATKPLDPVRLIEGWDAMLLGIPPHRFELLEKLRRRYRLFLFSNTNETHLRWVRQYLAEVYEMRDFDERFFEKCYYSHLAHIRKPDVAAFQFILQDAGLEATETLFIDDHAEHVQGAQLAGLQAIHHDPKMDIAEVLKDY